MAVDPYLAGVFSTAPAGPAPPDPDRGAIAAIVNQQAANIQQSRSLNPPPGPAPVAQANTPPANPTGPGDVPSPAIAPPQAIIPGTDPTIPPDPTVEPTVNALGKAQVAREANQTVQGGDDPDVKAQIVQGQANDYNQVTQPTSTAAVSMQNTLATNEPTPARADLLTIDRHSIESERYQNQVYAVHAANLAINSLNIAENNIGGIQGGVTGTMHAFGEMLDDLVPGGRSAMLYNTLHQFVDPTEMPSMAEWAAGIGRDKAIKSLNEKILEMAPQDARLFVNTIVNTVMQHRQGLTDDQSMDRDTIQAMFSPFTSMGQTQHEQAVSSYQYATGEGAKQTSFWNKAGAALGVVLTDPTFSAYMDALNLAGFISPVKGAASFLSPSGFLARRMSATPVSEFISTGIPKNSPVGMAAQTTQGASSLIPGFIGPPTQTEAVARAMGTTPGEIFGSMSAPKWETSSSTEGLPTHTESDLSAAQLPPDLGVAAPRLGMVPLNFENDTDKALYMVQRAKANKAAMNSPAGQQTYGRYYDWLREQGLTGPQIAARGADIDTHVANEVRANATSNDLSQPVTIGARNTDTLTLERPSTKLEVNPGEGPPEAAGPPPGPAQAATQVQTSVGPQLVDRGYRVPYLGGSNGVGTVYADKDWNPHALLGGQWVDRTPFLAEHEAVEAHAETQLGMDYTDAHALATKAEKAKVEAAGLNWDEYQASYKNDLKKTEVSGAGCR